MEMWQCYCDESYTAAPHRYMVIGGMLIRKCDAMRIGDDFSECRARSNMLAELKWQKVSNAKFKEYVEIVDICLKEIAAQRLAFCAVILDRHKIDHRTHNSGCEVTGISKFYYQMILNRFVRLMDDGDRLCIFPDKHPGRGSFSGLQGSLNKSILKRYGKQRNVVTQVTPICSKSSNIAQANDIFAGAVGFHANARHKDPSSRMAKKFLSYGIGKAVRHCELSSSTPIRRQWFGVWRFALQELNKKGTPNPSPEARSLSDL